MTIFAIAGILSASTLPLRVSAYILPFWCVTMVAIAVHASVRSAAWHVPVLLTLGFVFVGFGVTSVALYVARIYKNGLGRPNAIVRHHLSILPTSEFRTDARARISE